MKDWCEAKALKQDRESGEDTVFVTKVEDGDSTRCTSKSASSATIVELFQFSMTLYNLEGIARAS